jgi:hypothetical protein
LPDGKIFLTGGYNAGSMMLCKNASGLTHFRMGLIQTRA